MDLFRKKMPHTAGEVDKNRLPRHIAIIMDGNGRWAKQRSLPRTAGHKAGAEVFRDIATYCKELGVAYLTVYAFSTENWKRPAEEVSAIMGLLRQYLLEAVDTMGRDNIRLKFFGVLSAIAGDQRALRRVSGQHLPELRRAGRDPAGRPAVRRGGGGLDGGELRKVPVLRRHP